MSSGSAKKSTRSSSSGGGVGSWFTCSKCDKRLPRNSAGKHSDFGCGGDKMYPHIIIDDKDKTTVKLFALLVPSTKISSKLHF